jgi:putative aldouronate transport system permease protein
VTAFRKSRGDRAFDWINAALLLLILLVLIYPLYFTVIASVSEPYDVVKGNVVFSPKGFTLEAYRNVFKESRIWTGYRNTIAYTLLGTLFNLGLTMPAAYVLSKRDLPGRSGLTAYFLITMYFSGGLIPTYLLVKSLNLINRPFTLIVLGGISVYNMIISRVYFQTAIPGELYESATMDGAGDFRCFFGIALPLSKPILAVIALYYGVGHWNAYFNALLYVSKSAYQPLQLVLRSILLLNEMALAELDPNLVLDADMVVALTRRAYLAEAMKYALIFIASAPLLMVYPFVQRHFVKGVMIGSLKG